MWIPVRSNGQTGRPRVLLYTGPFLCGGEEASSQGKAGTDCPEACERIIDDGASLSRVADAGVQVRAPSGRITIPDENAQSVRLGFFAGASGYERRIPIILSSRTSCSAGSSTKDTLRYVCSSVPDASRRRQALCPKQIRLIAAAPLSRRKKALEEQHVLHDFVSEAVQTVNHREADSGLDARTAPELVAARTRKDADSSVGKLYQTDAFHII